MLHCQSNTNIRATNTMVDANCINELSNFRSINREFVQMKAKCARLLISYIALCQDKKK